MQDVIIDEEVVETPEAPEETKKVTREDIANAFRGKVGPKRLFKAGYLPEGYRQGLTKQTLEKRTISRRKKNKNARKERRQQRLLA
jgi:hypothetical protein